ncbi:MAG TPA: cell division protein ZapA [Chitinophagaceae bacterium]|nr:MAG: cell division protein ZapA [Bacteroidetes bacterium OLB11]HMN33385.1 cell division protein ZapA [Chitinophagaceae bacterium]
MNEVSITIRICNRNYRIKVDIKNEQIVRDSIHQISQNIEKFHKHFPGRDDQDYMAMVLIDFITSKQNQNANTLSNEFILEKLKKINTLLDS